MRRFCAIIFTMLFCAFSSVFFQNCAEDLKSNADNYEVIPLPDPPRQNPDDPDSMRLSVLDTATVQSGALIFTIRVSKASNQNITVALESINGSAAAGQDFAAFNSSIVIPKGSLSVNVSIPTYLTGLRKYLQMGLKAVSISEGSIHYPIGLGTIAPLGYLPYPTIYYPISVGNLHSCAIGTGTTGTGSNAGHCWGLGTMGVLGNNSENNSVIPVRVRDTEKIKSLASGLDHSCALFESRTVRCWGSGKNNQLGNNKPPANSLIPVPVTDSSIIRQISAGYYFTCGLLENGTVKCWGNNSYGELGNGNAEPTRVAVEVKDIYNVKEISAGATFACALRANGTVYCWGNNRQGQLARPISTASSFIPVQISGITNAKSIAAGTYHACALLNDGTVKCWGAIGATEYFGQLGHGGTAGSATPTLVQGITGAKSIAASALRSCVINANNSIQCWGRHYSSTTGAYSATPSLSPIAIKETAGAASLTLGYTESCFANSANTIYKCWGAGRNKAYSATGTPIKIEVPVNKSN